MEPILKRAVDYYVPRVNKWLDRFLPSADTPPETVHRAMRYCVFAGGKRLRPLLSIAAFKWAGGSGVRVYPIACAIEMIHSYSLIHDDLPAMDDDDFRRGRPSCHRAFGEAVAILAGDALHARAFELLAKLDNVQIVSEVARAIGTEGLVGGQVADIELEGQDVSEADVRFIHQRKTAALFVATVRASAIAADANKKQISALTRYAKNLGLAFQIVDDILDIKGDKEKIGKNLHSDLKLDKATYPKAIGLERSQKLAEKLIDNARRAIASYPSSDGKLLTAIADFVLSRTY